MSGARVLLVAIALATTVAAACATKIELAPASPAVVRPLPLSGQLDFLGRDDFLPRAVAHLRERPLSHGPTFRYEYGVRYRHSSNAQLMNPLLLLGFRGIGLDVHATGRLEVARGDELIRSYQGSCQLKMRRSVWIWGHPSQTELRERALLAVRDQIDEAIRADAAALAGYVREGGLE